MAMIAPKTLRPGLLVSLSTSVTGNVVYRTLDIEADRLTEDGARFKKWETERTIQDSDEYERAIKARSKARSLVTAICAPSSFGLLCPEDRSDKLADAIEEAKGVAEEFNGTASITRVQVYVIVGRVAADDAEAARAINSEVRDLLAQMEQGVRNMNPGLIREAANKARALGSMLSETASERVKAAIETARKAARDIVKASDVAALEIDQQSLAAIASARTAFLDIDSTAEVKTVDAAPDRTIDFTPASPALQDLYGKEPIAARAIELTE